MNGVGLTTVKELLGHKKKAVESCAAILSGHYLDIKAIPLASALDTPESQPIEKAGAGSGDRTHTRTSPKGF
jgi:hypothetical protein